MLPGNPQNTSIIWVLSLVMGGCVFVVALCLTRLLGGQNPTILRIVWISSSIFIASLVALGMLLLH